ncbi:hypothetical protein Mal15_68040 [Stieleria maiorica]|uniref:Uncharacterized protein n=1 Tax=Stieleria maiorica TaxID=2795974 RepID=A0A5B9MMZ1_9BACT|nr:hypothetical protein Mal15_68040 [Stieleria maiorica]
MPAQHVNASTTRQRVAGVCIGIDKGRSLTGPLIYSDHLWDQPFRASVRASYPKKTHWRP